MTTKPNMKEFMDATGVDAATASELLYGVVGANTDTRNWAAIMSSSDPTATARQATAQMYSEADATAETVRRSTTDPKLAGKSQETEYIRYNNPTGKTTILQAPDGTYAIVSADGLAMRAGFSSLEQAQQQGVNFGVGLESAKTNLTIPLVRQPPTQPVSPTTSQPATGGVPGGQAATIPQVVETPSFFNPVQSVPQTVTTQVRPPVYQSAPTTATTSFGVTPPTGTFGSPLQTSGLSAVPSSVTHKTHYAGTFGLVDPTIVAGSQGITGVQTVPYSNDFGQQIMVTESNGVPMTFVPPGYTRSANKPQGQSFAQPVPGFSEGGSVSDPQLDAMYTMATKFLGYRGPKSRRSLEDFAKSSPGAATKMKAYTSAMAKGGLVKGYQGGGVVTQPAPGQLTEDQLAGMSGNLLSQTLQPIQSPLAMIQPQAADFIPVDAGQTVPVAPFAEAATVGTTEQAAMPQFMTPASFTPTAVSQQIADETARLQAAQGQVSPEAQIQAAQSQLSSEAMAEGAKFNPQYLQLVAASNLPVTAGQLVAAQGQEEVAVSSKIAQSAGIDPAIAAQSVVSESELPQPAQIAESNMAQAQAIISAGKLSQDATAVAAKLNSFSVDNGTLAQAVQGDVNAQDTVQGQLASLMRQFDDGTPAWAAGAIRAANAVMAARGLNGSSMAGAAILQAAMESALPIAAQDAQTFAQMNLSNLDRRQQVALTNAAAQQGLALQNLNNEQQAALQNSANAFQLQSQDLSNMQQTVLANAQIKAALQSQNLNNRQQANLAVAARYAEVANMNLNNRQQTALQNNMNTLQVELANLSNKQQSYIANAQLEAALQNKQIDARQQAAIANAARFSEAANIQFSAEQQANLHNSQLVSTIGLQELNNRQAATLQNAAQIAAMDMANLNNRQQAAVQNAQNFLQMDLTNLNNEQQTGLFKSQQNIQALFTDQAAENAALQFNAASENQTNQFFSNLGAQVSQFNATQRNAMDQFNVNSVNAMRQFNSEIQQQRDLFNAQNGLVIAQANAQWRQNIATLNTAAQNQSNMEFARTINALTSTNLDQIWQRERDIMSYAFAQSESSQDRALNILLADKNLDAFREKMRADNKNARAALGSRIFFSLFS
jgi:hypothetical protein